MQNFIHARRGREGGPMMSDYAKSWGKHAGPFESVEDVQPTILLSMTAYERNMVSTSCPVSK